MRPVTTALNHFPMIRRLPSDDMGLPEVGFGSDISTNGTIGRSGEECGLAGGGSGAGGPDSREFSRDSGEGGSNVLSTQGKKDLITTYLVVVKQWSRCARGQLDLLPP